MIFFIIPVSNDDLDKSSKKEFLCELYNDGKFLLSNKFNLKIVYIPVIPKIILFNTFQMVTMVTMSKAKIFLYSAVLKLPWLINQYMLE